MGSNDFISYQKFEIPDFVSDSNDGKACTFIPCAYLCAMTGNRKSPWLLFCFGWMLLLPLNVTGQLKVDTQIGIQEAISKLVGPGVRVSNIRVNCPSSGGRPYGYFTDNTGTLGMEDGLVITTGSAGNAVGPNNSGAKSQSNKNDNQDFDLASVVQVNEKQYDACVIEFDVEVFADTLTFDFVFGSEEYLEFIKDYHDVFGFFISGPGINGKRNLATLPGTQTSISVANVNNTANPQFYVDNGTGSTPFENLFVQYDGFTKRLESKVAVVPCAQYSLKLAICDIKDDIYDAGIFIAGKSLKTKAPQLLLRYEFPKFETAIEGCNGAFVKVRRQSRIQEPITFELRYGGTATRSQDYDGVPDQISFLAGDTSKEFFIPIYSDAIPDGEESILISLLNPCPGLPEVARLEVPIRETFKFDMPDARFCEGDSAQLNLNPAKGYEYTWSPTEFLSCSFCQQPVADPPATKRYLSVVRDIESGCEARDSLEVKVDPKPIAGFSFTSKPDYTSLDVFFKNESLFADAFVWTFGDGAGSGEKDPSHYYRSGFDMDSVSYPVILYAQNQALGCKDSASTVIRIGNPLFIPNLITPNGDQRNDVFFVRGIQPGIWKLEVFNRWGNRVYEESNYELDWTGDGLSPGVYFFLFQNPDGSRKYSGWVEVLR
jgi:gliding motility-associated-like protein